MRESLSETDLEQSEMASRALSKGWEMSSWPHRSAASSKSSIRMAGGGFVSPITS